MNLADKFGITASEQNQRKRFTRLSDEDIALLRSLQPWIEQHVDAIVDEFYTHLLTFPDARAFFPDDATLRRVKSTQRDYLTAIFRGEFDEAYFERRLQIGVTHERIRLVPKWYVGSFAIFQEKIITRLATHYTLRAGSLAKVVIALIKVMNLDQQLAIDTYIGSLVEKLRALGLRLGEATKSIAQETNQISTSASEQTAVATNTATGVSQTTTTVLEVRQTAEVASEKARLVADIAQRTQQTSEAGRKATEATAAGMQRIREQMEAIGECMIQLSEQSRTIGDIITTVDDVAQQSNLLAVNASIEAAKAGEHGKGFSVVAQEVRSLAEQSKQATAQVRGLLGDIQKATNAAAMATEQGSKAVDVGVRQAAEAGESIRHLSESIADSAQAAMQIAASSQQQLIGMDQVSSAMEHIKNTSVQNVESAKLLDTAARNLKELGQKLQGFIEQYRA
jgi:methyl-accepting chemotaxis protein